VKRNVILGIVALLLIGGFLIWRPGNAATAETVVATPISAGGGSAGESGAVHLVTSTTNWASFSEIAFSFRVTPELLLAGLIFAVVMGVLGGFFPARRASRQPVVQALR
jgi:putative ABC transport system permease protein